MSCIWACVQDRQARRGSADVAVGGSSATDVVVALRSHQSDAELVNIRKRLAPDEEAFGMRMRPSV